MLSRLGRLKTTLELSFDWSTFLARICHKQLLDDEYIHPGDIFNLVARKKMVQNKKRQNNISSTKIIQHWTTNNNWFFVVLFDECKFITHTNDGSERCWRNN